jgi:hypothetical protein
MGERVRRRLTVAIAAVAASLACTAQAAIAGTGTQRAGAGPWCNTALSPDARAALLQPQPARSRRIALKLDARSFSYWSTATNNWEIAPGCDTVAVGFSSAELPLRATVAQPPASCR